MKTHTDIATKFTDRTVAEIEKAERSIRRAGLVVLYRGVDYRGHFFGADSGVSGYDRMRRGDVLRFDRHGFVQNDCPSYVNRCRWASQITVTGDGFDASISHSVFALRAGLLVLPAICFALAATGKSDPIFDDSEAMFMVSKLRACGYTEDQVIAAMRAWSEQP